MSRLDAEARMTIKTLASRGTTKSDIARLLGVTEGTVRHHLARMQSGARDGRSRQQPKAAAMAAVIDHWRQLQGEEPINLAVLHQWLVSEYGYSGSLRSIQRYWARTYPAPAVRARRRVETPPGAQAQVDWAHFPAIVVGGIAKDLVGLPRFGGQFGGLASASAQGAPLSRCQASGPNRWRCQGSKTATAVRRRRILDRDGGLGPSRQHRADADELWGAAPGAVILFSNAIGDR